MRLGVELERQGQVIDGARLGGHGRDERCQPCAERATGHEADAAKAHGLEERAPIDAPAGERGRAAILMP